MSIKLNQKCGKMLFLVMFLLFQSCGRSRWIPRRAGCVFTPHREEPKSQISDINPDFSLSFDPEENPHTPVRRVLFSGPGNHYTPETPTLSPLTPTNPNTPDDGWTVVAKKSRYERKDFFSGFPFFFFKSFTNQDQQNFFCFFCD